MRLEQAKEKSTNFRKLSRANREGSRETRVISVKKFVDFILARSEAAHKITYIDFILSHQAQYA